MLRSQTIQGGAFAPLKRMIILGIAGFLILGGWVLTAQDQVLAKENLTDDQKRVAITALVRLLKEQYVFPDKAQELASMIETNLQSGIYASLNEPKQFADTVTKHLRSLNGDQHLNLSFQPQANTSENESYSQAFYRSRGKQVNYGLEQVSILEGNIGYIKMNHFSLDELYEEAQPTVTAAMGFVSNTDALIFDLRNNGGGSARMIKYLASYLHDETPVHLNDYYFRTSDQTVAYWTLTDVPGKRLPALPTYVLINKNTFSAAEAFAYNLKHLGRVTIIGETSAGGAHGGSTSRVSDLFTAYIPFSRSIHPVTKTDWEGTGVVPHIKTSSEEALLIANINCLEGLQKSPLNQEHSALYAKALAVLKVKKSPIKVPLTLLKSYTGDYELGPEMRLTISLQNGILFGQMTGDSQPVSLMPVSQTRFRVDAHDKEFSFNLDESGLPIGLTLHQGNGIIAKKVD